MKAIIIANPVAALSADHTALGGAIKAIVAGGSELDDDEIRRASGLTEYVWHRKGAQVMRLVRELSEIKAEA